MTVKDYKELRVYRLGFESAMQIFHLSKRWPTEEKYSLIDQIRRSSRSVCTNIAEAWRKRRYEPAFVSKLSDSDGEAAETEVHLDFSLGCGYLAQEEREVARSLRPYLSPTHEHDERVLLLVRDQRGTARNPTRILRRRAGLRRLTIRRSGRSTLLTLHAPTPPCSRAS